MIVVCGDQVKQDDPAAPAKRAEEEPKEPQPRRPSVTSDGADWCQDDGPGQDHAAIQILCILCIQLLLAARMIWAYANSPQITPNQNTCFLNGDKSNWANGPNWVPGQWFQMGSRHNWANEPHWVPGPIGPKWYPGPHDQRAQLDPGPNLANAPNSVTCPIEPMGPHESQAQLGQWTQMFPGPIGPMGL